MNDSTFQREDRYIVIKRSDLEKVPVGYWSSLIEPIGALQAHLPHRECLVIESDWPEYEQAWRMIERRMAGQPPVTAAEELEAVLHWRDKHAVAIKERDALQQRLNVADQRIDELTQERESLIAYGRNNGLHEASTVCSRMAYDTYYPAGSRFKHFVPKALEQQGNLLIKAANAIAALPDGPIERHRARQQKKAAKSATA